MGEFVGSSIPTYQWITAILPGLMHLIPNASLDLCAYIKYYFNIMIKFNVIIYIFKYIFNII